MKNRINNSDLEVELSDVLSKARQYKFDSLKGIQKESNPNHYYDDDISRTISEIFSDEISVYPILGDLIRFLGGLLKKRTPIKPQEFIKIAINKLFDENLSREEISELTKICEVRSNLLLPFMNGGPAGENWNNSKNGFYDWITNKSQESILGIELGFKADDYGLEVSKKLIDKKKANPDMIIRILVDGFVSLLMQKPPSSLEQFEQNTLTMIEGMEKSGIEVIVNNSFNPVSTNFLAANHIKLWIFDGTAAFFGGIGIESQFRSLMYDEMDLVQGPFVRILTMMALLLMKNQKADYDAHFDKKPNPSFIKDEIMKYFVKEIPEQGNITLRLSMNVPGYVQDAQKDYVELLTREDVQEIFILVPYFSDHKVARGLVKVANRLYNKLAREKENELKSRSKDSTISRKDIDNELSKDKKIHVIFPTKQENVIIADVSKYYAYYLRNNPIVETRQFFAKSQNMEYQMLHAKQMVVILKDDEKNWTKYVKFGGSYNPAGRAQNMWELNAIQFRGKWDESDDVLGTHESNPIKDYLNDVMKTVLNKYTEPFYWGTVNAKLSIPEIIAMNIARRLWF